MPDPTKEKDLEGDIQEVESEESAEETPAEEEPHKKQEEGEETPKEGEESEEQGVEDLLQDGTPKDKRISVKKDKYDEAAEKAKLYDSFSPLLAKLNENPEKVDELMGKGDETVEQRVARLEREKQDEQKARLRTALEGAVSRWPDFREKWSEIKPIKDSLEKQGVPTEQALERAYYAINPQAYQQDGGEAQRYQNQQGTFSSSPGASKQFSEEEGEYKMTPGDKEVADRIGIPYKLYQKHAQHIRKFEGL